MHGMPQIGDVVDDMYEIRKQLGAGGFGAVYLARHIPMDRDVALKMLLAHGPRPEEMIERFKREVMAIRVLSHPNTVRIFDYRDSAQGLLYYTMEYLRGETLKDLTKREGPQSPKRVHYIFRQVLKSLSEAHSYGIIHRDLKPANIMLVHMHGEVDFVKVLDFGIAKILDQNEGNDDEEDPLTSAGMLVGTLRYMAPEQITGGQLGPYTDLYSLALIMVELLSGQSVFAGTGRWEIFQKQISTDAIEITPEILQSPLGEVLSQALNKHPAQRFATADELLKALDAIPVNLLSDDPLSSGSGRVQSRDLGGGSSSGSFSPNSGSFGLGNNNSVDLRPVQHNSVDLQLPPADQPQTTAAVEERAPVLISADYADDGATIVTDMESFVAEAPVALAPSTPQLQPQTQPLPQPKLNLGAPKTVPLSAITAIDTADIPAPSFDPEATQYTPLDQLTTPQPEPQAPLHTQPIQAATPQPLFDNFDDLEEPKPASSKKGLIIGLPIAALLIAGLAIAGVVYSKKSEEQPQQPATIAQKTDPPAAQTQTPPPSEQVEPKVQPDQAQPPTPDTTAEPAPTEEPEVKGPIMLTLTTNDGLKAEVFQGDKRLGTTPLPFEFNEPVELTFKHEGYAPKTLAIKDGTQDQLEIALEKLPEPAAPTKPADKPADKPVAAKPATTTTPKPNTTTKPADKPTDKTDSSWVDIGKKPKKPKEKPNVPIFN